MGSDRLLLKGMAFWGYHGCAPEEAVLGQKFIVDLELYYDMTLACHEDKFADSFGYDEAYAVVKRVVTGERYNMFQRVAQRIAEEMFKLKPNCRAVITIRKPSTPIGGIVEYSGVTIVRDGPAYKA